MACDCDWAKHWLDEQMKDYLYCRKTSVPQARGVPFRCAGKICASNPNFGEENIPFPTSVYNDILWVLKIACLQMWCDC